MAEVQPSTYYPACKVRIQLRWENYAKDTAQAVIPNRNDRGQEGFGEPQPIVEEGVDFDSTGFDFVPESCTVEKNTYRKSDEARVVVAARRFPFDPRTIRGARIQVFGGVYFADEFDDAMSNPDFGALILGDTITRGKRAGTNNEIFRGFADEIEMNLGAHDTVEFSCRDLTSPFIDAELPESAVKLLSRRLPLDEVIRLIIFGDGNEATEGRGGLPGMRGTAVVNEATEPRAISTPLGFIIERDPLPSLGDTRLPNYFDSKKNIKKGRKNPAKGTKISYWDLITDLCVASGFIVYVRPGQILTDLGRGRLELPASEVVISSPRTYYSESSTSGPISVPENDIRQFFYGVNIEDLVIRRKLRGVVTPSVEVRSFDTTRGRTLREKWPPRKANTQPSTNGKGDREEIQVFTLDEVGGPKAQAILRAAAKSIYEQLARPEMQVRVKTKTLSALVDNLGDGSVADIFQLEPGDPILLQVDRAQVETGQVSRHSNFEELGEGERIQLLIEEGYFEDVAKLAVKPALSQFLQREFRTQTVIGNFDLDSGWQFEVHAINFLDIRNAVEEAAF